MTEWIHKRCYRDILREQLVRRQKRNRAYSQAAFARDIGLSASRFNEVLKAKQGLSPGAACAVADRLALRGEDREHFCDLVICRHARERSEREAASLRLRARRERTGYRTLKLDTFRVIRDWWHLTILELTKTDCFVATPSWIAGRLGIPTGEAADALLRLRRVGLIEIRDGRWVPTSANNCFPGGFASRAGKIFHTQMLNKAVRALHASPIDKREFSTTLLAVSPADLPQVKRRIQEFWQTLDAELASTPVKSDVFCLAIQFFDVGAKGA